MILLHTVEPELTEASVDIHCSGFDTEPLREKLLRHQGAMGGEQRQSPDWALARPPPLFCLVCGRNKMASIGGTHVPWT